MDGHSVGVSRFRIGRFFHTTQNKRDRQTESCACPSDHREQRPLQCHMRQTFLTCTSFGFLCIFALCICIPCLFLARWLQVVSQGGHAPPLHDGIEHRPASLHISCVFLLHSFNQQHDVNGEQAAAMTGPDFLFVTFARMPIQQHTLTTIRSFFLIAFAWHCVACTT